jgi:hypothetical protein
MNFLRHNFVPQEIKEQKETDYGLEKNETEKEKTPSVGAPGASEKQINLIGKTT